MNGERYKKITDFFKKNKMRYYTLFLMGQFVPVLMASVYGVVCVVLLFAQPWSLIRFAGVPMAGFLIVTGLRALISRKRPYEVYDFYPVNFRKKLKQGKSFPSRHTASAALIAMAFFAISPEAGAVMMLLAVVVALSRVFAGEHFPSDVAAGLAFGIIVGLIGFCVQIF